MSKAGEEEEDDEECFHDSLDRLLSSSNTSCSCSPSTSDPEEDYDPNSHCSSDYNDPVPKFPRGVSQNYDVWVSQPSSVEERRVRLLRQMGLTRDPSLLRHRPSLPLSLSLASHHLSPLAETRCGTDNNTSEILDNASVNVNVDDSGNSNGKTSGMARSKSDGDGNSHEAEIHSKSSATVGSVIDVNNDCDCKGNNQSHCCTKRSRSSNQIPVISTVSPNKPPKVKIRIDCNGNGNAGSLLPVPKNEDLGGKLELIGSDDMNAMCMIKNLDNGKEFVVNEVREDGTWEKIKELGTGRQLTMEEFSSEMCVGTSPIVQELMRRQNVEDGNKEGLDLNADGNFGTSSKSKKRGSWLRSIKSVASSVTGHKERRSSDERDTSSEKGGRRSSSATDDSQDVSFHGPERVRVKQYGKSVKELTALYKSQEIKAHNGSIWAIKFSLDGKYLASAGEDCVIHVWQVLETERKGDYLFDKLDDVNFNLLFLANGSPEPSSPNLDSHSEKKRRGRSSLSRKSVSLEQILVPDTVFALLEKPFCSLQGHLDDVLDLSWSKSQQLLSSSMDKTVRLWDLSSKSCLKTFSHSDYVTCIQFNPVDDKYFISGSLDAKVRIWSIPDRQVVDWNDLHEMVTAACYTPDGQGALVGSYKGSCRLYNTSENKLLQKSQINLQNKKKKSHQKKITGFQFAPGSTSEFLVTSADSRIRVVDGVDLVHKFKGFHNTNSQISASVTSNGKYIVAASEDSYVYIWKHEGESRPNRSKSVKVTQSYELFHCQDVSVAIPWPGMSDTWALQDSSPEDPNGTAEHFEALAEYHPTAPVEEANGSEGSPIRSRCSNSPLNGPLSSGYLSDRISATWPEEKLLSAAKSRSPRVSVDMTDRLYQNRSAWGMVVVTAGLKGEIRTYQNFGLPFRI